MMKRSFPDTFFERAGKQAFAYNVDWPDDLDVRKAVDWFVSIIGKDKWNTRRANAANRLYSISLREAGENDNGRLFEENDAFGWYLFCAEALIEHFWNYEPSFGARVVPIFKKIGNRLDLLRDVEGVEVRALRLATDERQQPQGGLFELLVAIAYREQGAEVCFVPEEPGIRRTHDLNVTIGPCQFAVECKHMRHSEYGESERARIRELWRPAAEQIVPTLRSTFCNCNFQVPIDDVPVEYFSEVLSKWRASAFPNLIWHDEIAFGSIGEIDLGPIKSLLRTDDILGMGTRIPQLLTGAYVRNANYVQLIRMKYAENPRYITDLDFACLLRWSSNSNFAINAKAREVKRKLSDALGQLPDDKPSVVHIGFDALEGDQIEQRRYEKILDTMSTFGAGDKRLSYVYCHYFSPEAPPEGDTYAFDETAHWIGLKPEGPPPLDPGTLLLPEGGIVREGMHFAS